MNKTTKAGLNICEALTLLFIGLRLCKVIDWSWIWILAPTWIPIVLYILLVLGLHFLFSDRKPRKAVYCRECEYRGCIYSDGMGGKDTLQ